MSERTDSQGQCCICGKTKEQVPKLIVGLHGAACSDCIHISERLLTKDGGQAESAETMDWDETVNHLRNRAQAMHNAREAALVRCRELVQLSAKSIRHVHRRQFEQAVEL